MAFIRIKKIKGKEYAYVVENKWKGKGARQKVRGYLGRVVRLQRGSDSNFFEYFKIVKKEEYLKNISKDDLIANLVKLELINHGFVEDKGLLRNGDITVDLSKIEVSKRKRKVALAMNDGFLANLTLKKIIGFNETGSQAELSLKLAKAFVEAGVNVSEELFVAVYEKIV